jgi:hypothetical protein
LIGLAGLRTRRERNQTAIMRTQQLRQSEIGPPAPLLVVDGSLSSDYQASSR